MPTEQYQLNHLGYKVGDACHVLPRRGRPIPGKVTRISATGQVTVELANGNIRRFVWSGHEIGAPEYGARLPTAADAIEAVVAVTRAEAAKELQAELRTLLDRLSPREAIADPTTFVHNLDQIREKVVAHALRAKEALDTADNMP